MSAPRTSLPSSRFSPFTLFAWSVVGYNILVILWGAYVRATGSGAGCGSHWPLCNGEVIPRAPRLETLIEYSHRLTSGLALIALVVLLVWALRAFPRRHPVRAAAWASMGLMLLEAALGAGLVLFELVADNETMARALFMGVHLMNTFLLLGAMALTAHWSAGENAVPLRHRDLRLKVHWLLYGAFLGLILTGMSGSVSALGDTLYPSGSLQEALRQDLSVTGHILIRLRILHPLIAIGTSLLVFVLARRQLERRDAPAAVHRAARYLVLAVFLQLAGGLLNVALLAPIWMQQVHLLMADVVWILLVLFADAVTRETATPSPIRRSASPVPSG
jgi:heme a synthase